MKHNGCGYDVMYCVVLDNMRATRCPLLVANHREQLATDMTELSWSVSNFGVRVVMVNFYVLEMFSQ